MFAERHPMIEVSGRVLRTGVATWWILFALALPAAADTAPGAGADVTVPVITPDGAAGTDPFDTPEQARDLTAELDFFKVESEVVTSVSRNPESLFTAAAAIYVITGEEITASGAQSVMDALRMVPGVDVAAVDRNSWAIQARGFNNMFADKMLVLLDGRPIYTPLFGGTLWHQWETFLPDIDRIEVIRGPGGTLWGANAVNGVINIITKTSEDTHGAYVRAEGGSNYHGKGEARWGGEVEHFNYRGWIGYERDEGFGGDGGRDQNDSRRALRGGYRFDWDLGKGLMLRSSGEAADTSLGSMTLTAPDGEPQALGQDWTNKLFSGVMKLEKDFANGSSAQLLMGGDYIAQDAPFISLYFPAFPPFIPEPFTDKFTIIRRGFYADFQHSFRPHRRHRLTWGGNYWLTNVDVNDSAALGLDPDDDGILNVGGGFIQDEISLWEHGKLTIGSKFEANTFTGFNWQPSIRLAHEFENDTAAWGSISRAVNTPAYGDMFVDFLLPADTTTIPGVTIQPIFTSAGVDDTTLVSFEAGVRRRFNDEISIDVAAFYNIYDDLVTFSGETTTLTPADCGQPGGPTTCVASTFLDNKLDAQGGGIEAVFDLRFNDRIRGEVNGTWQRISSDGDTNVSVPEWKVNLRGYVDVLHNLSVVPTVHFVDRIEIPSIFGGATTGIDGYARFDIAAHYKPFEKGPTISAVGQNLNQRRHAEFSEPILRPVADVTRTWFIRIDQEF